ncbi:hypothetical protein [Nocardia thailandica]|uniref:hypothetical protein n=1 Tax=Nocardia thailandica TaxID=257275 RepID=UPI000305A915|nr:hypothetical protein [Nocardia thailandica]
MNFGDASDHGATSGTVPDEPASGVGAWRALVAFLALVMADGDLVALVPLGSWMAAYGIVPVCSAYLLHVLDCPGFGHRLLLGGYRPFT